MYDKKEVEIKDLILILLPLIFYQKSHVINYIININISMHCHNLNHKHKHIDNAKLN